MQYTKQLGYATVSAGETVRPAFANHGRNESTAEFVLRTHRETGRAQFAREAVANLDQRLANHDHAPVGVVVEKVHSTASVRTVQRRFDGASIVWIQTPLSIRLRRLRQREGEYTMADLLRRDLRELNSGLSNLASPLDHDYSVRNDGSREAFERRLDIVFE